MFFYVIFSLLVFVLGDVPINVFESLNPWISSSSSSATIVVGNENDNFQDQIVAEEKIGDTDVTFVIATPDTNVDNPNDDAGNDNDNE